MTLLHNVTLPSGARADVLLAEGRIASVHSGRAGAHGPEVVDLSGHLLLPAPVEAHAHLDKAYTADAVRNRHRDLPGAVRAWLRHRARMSHQDIAARASAAVWEYVSHGATLIRTHVDVGDDIGLRALHAVLEVRAEHAGRCEIQIVAFGTGPLSGVEGANNRAVLRDASADGADALGACPGHDPEPLACIRLVLELAGTRRLPVDMHIDETSDPVAPCALELLADAVLASSFEPGVVAGHCVSLAAMPPPRARDVAERVARAGIAVVCLPQTNLYLLGRMTAMRLLREAGVTVAAGGDNLQDPFNPLGRADPLETAGLMVLAGHDSPDRAYAAVSADARRALGRPAIAVVAGAPAELLAIRARSVGEAMALAGTERVVIHNGNVVVRTTTRRDWAL
jgi:cytosine deaminase